MPEQVSQTMCHTQRTFGHADVPDASIHYRGIPDDSAQEARGPGRDSARPACADYVGLRALHAGGALRASQRARHGWPLSQLPHAGHVAHTGDTSFHPTPLLLTLIPCLL